MKKSNPDKPVTSHFYSIHIQISVFRRVKEGGTGDMTCALSIQHMGLLGFHFDNSSQKRDKMNREVPCPQEHFKIMWNSWSQIGVSHKNPLVANQLLDF